MNAEEIAAHMAALSDWETHDGKAISRRFPFRDYAQALAFVIKISALAEAANHHPDITFGWGYAHVLFTTHATGGLHRNDFIMAHRADAAYETNA